MCIRDSLRIDELGHTALLCVLPSTPPVLTIGRRCMREGFSFIWKAGELPYMIRPDGLIVPLQVSEGIPYLEPSTLLCKPAPPASTTSVSSPTFDAAPSVMAGMPHEGYEPGVEPFLFLNQYETRYAWEYKLRI